MNCVMTDGAVVLTVYAEAKVTRANSDDKDGTL